MRVLALPKQRWTHACESHVGGSDFCGRCGYRKWLHTVRRYPCSQCGGMFLRRDGFDSGYSHCIDHKRSV